ncbi:MAG: hypothetical protein Q4E57_02380 [Eubacteriales bacterium]|nr:hypothetical protein [Eubacteriales bacterium]
MKNFKNKHQFYFVQLVACAAAAVLCLSGCGSGSGSAGSDLSADDGKTAIMNASTLVINGDNNAINDNCPILADDRTVGSWIESGFVDTKWTVSAGSDEWFYFTDEASDNLPNKRELVFRSYTIYDMSDQRMGYLCESTANADGTGDDRFYFYDADGNEKEYYADGDLTAIYDANGTLLVSSHYAMAPMGLSDAQKYDLTIQVSNNEQVDIWDELSLIIGQQTVIRRKETRDN